LKVQNQRHKEVEVDYKKMEKFIFGKGMKDFENDAKKILE